jgi:hypothetical protein
MMKHYIGAPELERYIEERGRCTEEQESYIENLEQYQLSKVYKEQQEQELRSCLEPLLEQETHTW